MTKEKSGLNRLIKRLLTDRIFAKEFRKGPKAWARRYRLSEKELEAVLEGDESYLISLGLDPSLVEPKESHKGWLVSALLRIRSQAAAVAALMLLIGAPATALGRTRRTRALARKRRTNGGYLIHPIGVRALRRRADTTRTRRTYILTRKRVSDFARSRRTKGSAFGVYDNTSDILLTLQRVDPSIGLFRPPGDLPPLDPIWPRDPGEPLSPGEPYDQPR